MDVLLDLDGTLIDPKPGLIGSIQYALSELGQPVPPADQLLWMIGPPFRVSFPKLLGSNDHTEQAIALYRRNYVGGAMYEAIVYHGITDALARLQAQGCRLFVATSKPHRFARPILEHFGLAPHFAAIHGPELDGSNDHKRDLIAHMVDMHAISAASAVMVGDRALDITAGAHNGLRTVGVTWGYGSLEELTAAGATSLCRAPLDLAQQVLDVLRPSGHAP
jgi:phosphoglycolate phosphatase